MVLKAHRSGHSYSHADDVLAGLEVYSFTDQPASLPSPEDLRPFEQLKTEQGGGEEREIRGGPRSSDTDSFMMTKQDQSQ